MLGFAGEVLELLDPQIDNFPIKGYTVVKPDDLDVQLAGGAQSVVLYVGDDPTTLTLELVGDDAAKNDINDMMREWWLVDGGDQLVSLEPVGEGTQVRLVGSAIFRTWLILPEIYEPARLRGVGPDAASQQGGVAASASTAVDKLARTACLAFIPHICF